MGKHESRNRIKVCEIWPIVTIVLSALSFHGIIQVIKGLQVDGSMF